MVVGIGIGMRMDLAQELLETKPPEIGWLEIHPENYMRRGGRYRERLARCREHWPVVTHGLTMCFASLDPIDPQYASDLRQLLDELRTPWHSDHLCFAGVDGVFAHDLLPVPFTDESARLAARRVIEARDRLDRPIAVENVSYYAPSMMSTALEEEFVVDVLERADALLLLDVNNVYVNSKNHGFDAYRYIDRIPPERVVQIHVAGHYLRKDGIRIDTHGEAVCNDVYDLLEYTLRRMGPKPVLLERDNNIPPFAAIMEEVRRLRAIYDRATSASRAAPAQVSGC